MRTVSLLPVAVYALMISLFASNPITNTNNGISISLGGTNGSDYAYERWYYDETVDEHGTIYLKSDTKITLSHNANNSISEGTHGGREIIGGDKGTIRMRLDLDLCWKYDWAYSSSLLPAYPGPFSLSQRTFPGGVPVVGTTGPKPGTSMQDMVNFYYRGITDDFGDEWHTLGVGDDDTWRGLTGSQVENGASDGWTYNLVVNPKTPCIAFETAGTGAQFFTTAAKAYFIPHIGAQTSYVTDNVDIVLANIMTADNIMYRFGTGAFQKYTGPISSNTLADGEHVLEYYYQDSHHRTRRIVKNPGFPSDQDYFPDGTGHGYLIWRDQAEFDRFKARLATSGPVRDEYNAIKSKDSGSLTNALVAAVEGVGAATSYARAAKSSILASQLFMDRQGHEKRMGQRPLPCKNLHSYGYYTVNYVFNAVFAYDLLITTFRAPKYTDGFTPIEDLKVREGLAGEAHKWMWHGMWGDETYTDRTGVDPDGLSGMWSTAMSIGGLVCALALPGYDSPVFGTSGFDGTPATHKWAPFPDNVESWKDVYITYTNRDIPEHVARLKPHPNRRRLYNWYDEGLILAGGDWFDRVGYNQPALMGHCFHVFANVVKRRLDITYPLLETYFSKMNDGTVKAMKDGGATVCYPQIALINEYFPNVAGKAESNISGCKWTKNGECLDFGHYLYIARTTTIPGLVWYNPNWKADTPNPVSISEGKSQIPYIKSQKGLNLVNPVMSLFTNHGKVPVQLKNITGARITTVNSGGSVHLRPGVYLYHSDVGPARKMVVGQ